MSFIDSDELVTKLCECYCDGCENYGGAKCGSCQIDDVIGIINDLEKHNYKNMCERIYRAIDTVEKIENRLNQAYADK